MKTTYLVLVSCLALFCGESAVARSWPSDETCAQLPNLCRTIDNVCRNPALTGLCSTPPKSPVDACASLKLPNVDCSKLAPSTSVRAVPEMDARSGGLGIAFVIGMLLLGAERLRRRPNR